MGDTRLITVAHIPRRRDRAAAVRPPAATLPPIQREILRLLASGGSDDRVADALGIGLRTVQRHVACLMELLGARSRFEAGVAAARAGWLDPTNDDHQASRYGQYRGRFAR